jgi:hypothetical protein
MQSVDQTQQPAAAEADTINRSTRRHTNRPHTPEKKERKMVSPFSQRFTEKFEIVIFVSICVTHLTANMNGWMPRLRNSYGAC